MQKDNEDRYGKLNEAIFIAKILTMIISAVILVSQGGLRGNGSNSGITMAALMGLFTIIFFMYGIWIIFNPEKRKKAVSNIKNLIEIAIFILFFNSIILYSGGHESPHKFLYLFIIITTTLQHGTMMGFATAFFSMTMLMFVDFVAMPGEEVNFYFQNDIILSSLFFLTAWVLGKHGMAEEFYRKELRDIANIDEMTMVFNYRYFQEALRKHFKECREKGDYLALLFIDVDDFKKVNDVFGHFTGDEVLKDVAKLICDNVRDGDVVSRYGGEEFTVLLPGKDEGMAIAIAERIRTAIGNNSIKHESFAESLNVTVSIGVSVFPDKALTMEELLKNADKALYEAKGKNKNRVEIK
jgi:diguanylate cyclase (GGDEF)-like protein